MQANIPQLIVSCRPGCAACCIAISISTPIPGMPEGKPAGVPCVQLDDKGLCLLFGKNTRPQVCLDIIAGEDCGSSKEEAMENLRRLELLTSS